MDEPATDSPTAWWRDFRIAAAFLTRLPVDAGADASPAMLARASRCFPLVGLLVGLCSGIAFAIATSLSLHPLLAALFAVAATVGVTGALHEDGLADVADGFGGGAEREDKLAIMRDSRIGTFGVLALTLSVLARVAALAALATPAAATAALIAAHAGSRGFVAVVMQREPLARQDGMAAAAGRPSAAAAWWALGLGAAIALIAAQGPAIIAFGAGAVAALGVVRLARQQIGGYTGDVLGAIQQAAEIVILVALVALS